MTVDINKRLTMCLYDRTVDINKRQCVYMTGQLTLVTDNHKMFVRKHVSMKENIIVFA